MARHTIPETIERAVSRPGPVQAPERSLAVNLILSLRPPQWTKNLFIFLPLLLSSRLVDPSAVAYSLAGFAIFCLLSGVVYLINDVADREADRRHPVKMRRPIASGVVPVRVAIATAFLLGAVVLSAAFWIRPTFGILSAVYVGLLALYSGVMC
jgi:4-hydroxybenzoate polyprenyltransferase